MAKELEIARNVQMSLLPKENPHVAGFDIAGICIPAFEVGSDYYDFVYLGDNKMASPSAMFQARGCLPQFI